MKDSCYIVIGSNGIQRMTKGPSSLKRHEISVRIQLSVPDSCFADPAVSVSIDIPESAVIHPVVGIEVEDQAARLALQPAGEVRDA